MLWIYRLMQIMTLACFARQSRCNPEQSVWGCLPFQVSGSHLLSPTLYCNFSLEDGSAKLLEEAMSSSATALFTCVLLGSTIWFSVVSILSIFSPDVGWQHLLSARNFLRLLVLVVVLGDTTWVSKCFTTFAAWPPAVSLKHWCPTTSPKTISSSSDTVSSLKLVSEAFWLMSWATKRMMSSFLLWMSFKSSTLVTSGLLTFWNEFLPTAWNWKYN